MKNTASKPMYTAQQQTQIKTEADEAVKKALAGVTKKYAGVIIGHELAITFPSSPVIVSHTGTTRPLNAHDATVPPPEALES